MYNTHHEQRRNNQAVTRRRMGVAGHQRLIHIFTHPAKPGHISVPHPRKDLGVGLVNKLLKQADLK